MEGKLFLGIADNGRSASVVVGDGEGRIISTCVGGSVNYHFWGIEQARANLRDIIVQTVGWDRRASLAGVCFTYKADFAATEWKTPDLVSGLLETTCVKVEDFAATSTLGIPGAKDRLLLIGGHSGLVIFEGETGFSHQMRQEEFFWSPCTRLNAKLATVTYQGDLEDLLHLKTWIRTSQCLATLTKLLDDLVDQGSAVAVEVAYDVAYDLVRLVTSMATHFSGLDPVIGLHGQILLGSRTIRDRVYHLIGLLFPQSQVVDAPLAPAKGAYLSSVLTRRSGFEQEVINNLYDSTSDLEREGWLNFGSQISNSCKNH